MNRSFNALLAATNLLAMSGESSNGHHFGRYNYGGSRRPHHAEHTKPGRPHKVDRNAKRRAAKAGRRAARKHK